jgi:hypothetical protein
MHGNFPNPVFRVEDSDGVPLSGGLVYTYETGTSTPKATYADVNGTTTNANPIVLNTRGEATIYGSGVYKIIITEADGDTIKTVDPVFISGSSETIINILGIDSVEDIQNAATYAHTHNTDRQPAEAPDGMRRVFSTAERFVSGSLSVYINGMLATKDAEYTENTNRRGYTFLYSIQAGWVLEHRYEVDIS